MEERRSGVVMGIHGQASREGVFQWIGGPPKAGRKATLAYNKNSGALRHAQVSVHTPDASKDEHRGSDRPRYDSQCAGFQLIFAFICFIKLLWWQWTGQPG